MSVVFADLLAASDRIRPFINQTPVLTSRTLNERTGATVFLKAEPFQRTGSFKFRGATNAILQLSPAQRQAGVLTYSSGNHAQALALAGRNANVKVTVIMPTDAPAPKREATQAYGADVILYDRDETTREALGQQLCAESGFTLIPPYDHPHIVAGAGTTALEAHAQSGPWDTLFVCLGGGGLTSGCAIASRSLCPDARVYGVEPETANDAQISLRTGTLTALHNPPTIADGARTPSLSPLTFSLIRQHVTDILTVSDAELIAETLFAWERLKVCCEPTGVLALAALVSGQINVEGQRVLVILSGGNVDIRNVLAHAETHS